MDAAAGTSVVVVAVGIFVVVGGRSASAASGRAGTVDAAAVGMDTAGPVSAVADDAAIDGDATSVGECASTRRVWNSSQGQPRPEGPPAT
jgi:hypothetical protein